MEENGTYRWSPDKNQSPKPPKKTPDYKKAAAGWRYVGFIPKAQRGTGHIEEMDLIFEKEVE